MESHVARVHPAAVELRLVARTEAAVGAHAAVGAVLQDERGHARQLVHIDEGPSRRGVRGVRGVQRHLLAASSRGAACGQRAVDAKEAGVAVAGTWLGLG